MRLRGVGFVDGGDGSGKEEIANEIAVHHSEEVIRQYSC